ncbi:hypothetical protein ACFL5F_02570 [Planctomycetota bacterium]
MENVDSYFEFFEKKAKKVKKAEYRKQEPEERRKQGKVPEIPKRNTQYDLKSAFICVNLRFLPLTIPAFAGTSFLLTTDYFLGIFQPKAMVEPNKNRKFENIFYSILHMDLRRYCCLQFCRFSYQTRMSGLL